MSDIKIIQFSAVLLLGSVVYSPTCLRFGPASYHVQFTSVIMIAIIAINGSDYPLLPMYLDFT